MKSLCFIGILLLYSCTIYAQQQKYGAIDKYALSVGYLSVDSLAAKLTRPFKTEEQKVRSIFRWITGHIAYDIERYQKTEMPPLKPGMTAEAYNLWLLDYYANQALSKKKGICNDYACLFKLLCNKANLECEIVSGQARLASEDNDRDFGHAWNAVKIDGTWKLVDATWSAGVTDNAVTRFTKKFTERYYCIDPERMILDHFPENPKWQLCSTILPKEEFEKRVFFFDIISSFKIKSIAPNTNSIKVNFKDSIEISFVREDTNALIELGIDDGGYLQLLAHDQPESGAINQKTASTTIDAYKSIPKNYSKKIEKEIDDVIAYANSITIDSNKNQSSDSIQTRPIEQIEPSENEIPKVVYRYSPNKKGVKVKLLFASNKYRSLYIMVNKKHFAFYQIRYTN